MKKTVALSLLMLANIFLLAHAVLPHHHHDDGGICFVNAHHRDCDDEHHDTPTHQHEQEGNLAGKCCYIDVFFIPAHNLTLKSTCHIHSHCDCDHVLEATTPNTINIQDFVDKTLIDFRHKPFLVAYHTGYISQSLGLRAPPAC